jgi:hypothetical protein
MADKGRSETLAPANLEFCFLDVELCFPSDTMIRTRANME